VSCVQGHKPHPGKTGMLPHSNTSLPLTCLLRTTQLPKGRERGGHVCLMRCTAAFDEEGWLNMLDLPVLNTPIVHHTTVKTKRAGRKCVPRVHRLSFLEKSARLPIPFFPYGTPLMFNPQLLKIEHSPRIHRDQSRHSDPFLCCYIAVCKYKAAVNVLQKQ